MNPELETLKAIERQLEDANYAYDADSGNELGRTSEGNRLYLAVETALTIIKDRKQAIEEKGFNDPNYYQKARGEHEIP